MSKLREEIIELFRQNKGIKEIKSILNISEKQLFNEIREIINPSYDVKYNYEYDPYLYIDKPTDNSYDIYIPKSKDSFKCIVFSDMHIGNIDSDIRLLEPVYEYAIKNGINYMLVCGDNVEGDYTSCKRSIETLEDQVKTIIEQYPYDESIKNIMIFGNHDQHSLLNGGLDVMEEIRNNRKDFVLLGYGQGNVNLKNDSLVLFHKLGADSHPNTDYGEKIILSGHGHIMKTKIREQLWLCIPTLSYVSIDRTKQIIPGFVELEVQFEKDKFEYVNAKHIVITPKLIDMSETRCKVKCLTN